MTLAKTSVHLFANASSGNKDKQEVIDLAAQICKEQGRSFISHEAKDKSEIEDKAKEAASGAIKDKGLLIGVGGDGTARGLAQKIMGKDVDYAVVPCGTFNFFARAHHIPEDPLEAVRVALSHESMPVRLGDINGHVFLINASLGLYAKAISEREKNTKRFGRNRLVVIGSTFMSMVNGHRNLQVDMSTKGRTSFKRTPMIFIGNNALQLRDVNLNVSECMKTNSLAVVLAKPVDSWGFFQIALSGLTKNLEKEANLESFCADQLMIKTKSKTQKVALDGELFDIQSPFVIRAVPDAIRLIRPPGPIET